MSYHVLKKKPGAAVIAAIAVATVVTVNTAKVFISTVPEPTADLTAKVKQPTHVSTEATLPETETTALIDTTPSVILYDIPFSDDLQLHIIRVAESYGIDPAIIFAICYRESSYHPDSIGDYGNSFGLMQIQPKWHSDRMIRLGCTDLLDPYQNVIVGIDFLAEQRTRYGGDISKALVAYNAGHYSGTITMYAKEVLAKAEELRGTTYEAYR